MEAGRLSQGCHAVRKPKLADHTERPEMTRRGEDAWPDLRLLQSPPLQPPSACRGPEPRLCPRVQTVPQSSCWVLTPCRCLGTTFGVISHTVINNWKIRPQGQMQKKRQLKPLSCVISIEFLHHRISCRMVVSGRITKSKPTFSSCGKSALRTSVNVTRKQTVTHVSLSAGGEKWNW